MAQRVYKYNLEFEYHQVITLPSRSKILSVICQYDKAKLYVMVDDEQTKTTDISIYIHGTGHEVNENADYFLGSIVLRGGLLVLHVFMDSSQLEWDDMRPTNRLAL